MMAVDRSAVVTGAGQGIGRAVVDRLISDGWHCIGVERDPGLAALLEQDIGDRGAVERRQAQSQRFLVQ